MANTTETRKFVERAPIHDISERDFARVVSAALQAHYGPLKASAKCIANDAGASIQSAKNWLGGMCAPSAVYLKRLECKVPGLAAEMRRLQAMHAEHDPDFQRQWNELIRFVQANFSAESV